MEKTNNNVILEKILYSINDFNNEMLKSVNYIREDMSYMRGDIRELSREVNYLKNDVTSLKNDVISLKSELKEFKEENKKNWAKHEANRQQDRSDMLDILSRYDISISEQLGDPNVEKMRKIV